MRFTRKHLALSADVQTVEYLAMQRAASGCKIRPMMRTDVVGTGLKGCGHEG